MNNPNQTCPREDCRFHLVIGTDVLSLDATDLEEIAKKLLEL